LPAIFNKNTICVQHLISELQWRGLIHDIMPGTQEQFAKELTKVYCGFDPTSDSLHIGNLVPIIMLMHGKNTDMHQLHWWAELRVW
jgi:tyrosyl-tRNA synthetase